MKYTQIAPDAFKKLVLNAGVLCTGFIPSSGEISGLLGATTGDVSYSSNPEYEDFGADVNNVPANTMQLKRLKSVDPTLSGTYVSVDADAVKSLIGAADVSDSKISPRANLDLADFADIWLVADYSDVNIGGKAGYIAIHIFNALNTAGFSLTTTKDGKGNTAFEYHGHYDLDDPETLPYEVFVKSGEAAAREAS